jgi:hypothetical protein
MRKLSIFVAAFALATLTFWGTMLTDPPQTNAGVVQDGAILSPLELMIRSNLPVAEAADAI